MKIKSETITIYLLKLPIKIIVCLIFAIFYYLVISELLDNEIASSNGSSYSILIKNL